MRVADSSHVPDALEASYVIYFVHLKLSSHIDDIGEQLAEGLLLCAV